MGIGINAPILSSEDRLPARCWKEAAPQSSSETNPLFRGITEVGSQDQTEGSRLQCNNKKNQPEHEDSDQVLSSRDRRRNRGFAKKQEGRNAQPARAWHDLPVEEALHCNVTSPPSHSRPSGLGSRRIALSQPPPGGRSSGAPRAARTRGRDHDTVCRRLVLLHRGVSGTALSLAHPQSLDLPYEVPVLFFDLFSHSRGVFSTPWALTRAG